ncbi:hypothetical protein MAR_020287 [Mya arenaria]|uniref:Prohibitin n=1 Tax=Mya arenaria TaxID=6604 RepID=A0ABY7E4I7_MYAAR|nr:hypothetical protein MAR_020287 [Mya arenaria]
MRAAKVSIQAANVRHQAEKVSKQAEEEIIKAAKYNMFLLQFPTRQCDNTVDGYVTLVSHASQLKFLFNPGHSS